MSSIIRKRPWEHVKSSKNTSSSEWVFNMWLKAKERTFLCLIDDCCCFTQADQQMLLSSPRFQHTSLQDCCQSKAKREHTFWEDFQPRQHSLSHTPARLDEDTGRRALISFLKGFIAVGLHSWVHVFANCLFPLFSFPLAARVAKPKWHHAEGKWGWTRAHEARQENQGPKADLDDQVFIREEKKTCHKWNSLWFCSDSNVRRN